MANKYLVRNPGIFVSEDKVTTSDVFVTLTEASPGVIAITLLTNIDFAPKEMSNLTAIKRALDIIKRGIK